MSGITFTGGTLSVRVASDIMRVQMKEKNKDETENLRRGDGKADVAE